MLLQEPQLLTLVLRLISQPLAAFPSQLPVPGMHETQLLTLQ